jgi:hypothetical protein
MAVEVKANCDTKDINDHLKRLEIVRSHFDTHGDKRKILGGIACGQISDKLKEAAEENGLYVMVQTGDTVEIAQNKKIKVSPPIFPLRLGEGTGFNIQLVSSGLFDLAVQTGVAARQTYRRGVLISANKDQTAFEPAPGDIFDYGWENSLTARFSWRFFTVDLIGEVFFPRWKLKNYRVEELTADFRLALTRFLELSYQQQLTDRIAAGYEEAEGGERFESLNTVQLRLYLNY